MQSVSVYKGKRNALIWLGISIFCMIFAAVYEMFSFGVYSLSMILMFLYPLCLGTLMCIIFRRDMGRLWNDGVLLLTAAALIRGILEIYGTRSSYTFWLTALGILCIFLGMTVFYIRMKKRNVT